MTMYATLPALQAYLDIGGTLDANTTALLNSALTNASATIDDMTHRTFVAALDSTRKHDALCDVEGLRLWLRGDLAQLTSITNGDGATIPLTAIVTEPSYVAPYYALVFKRTGSYSWTYNDAPEEAISVTGRWAYSITPPDAIVQATLRLATWFYRQRDNALDLDRAVIVGNTTIAPSRIPADVITIIRPYLKRLP
jgi:hypothetical protein